MDAGDWLRNIRTRHNLTQAELALRAGTSQQAISRIESRRLSPSVGQLERFATACGEELVLGAQPRAIPYEPSQLLASAADPVEVRLERALSWNQLAGELPLAGRKAREDQRG